ncbi:hypothetical protein AMTR_s00144p00099030 [Amborella trichopoda]|uniref:Uncharacterized protein n=1 Tax=Amborella trichopoda TaxID=13333 RepID=W1P7Y4_AMBTC|nr:hypothetical protein AMTR_s00144p00099030 [Amborella trichopoda]
MVNSNSNVAEVRVSNLSGQVLGEKALHGSFVIFKVVKKVFSKNDLEPTIVERYVGPGFWQSPPPSSLPMPGLRLLWSTPPSALLMLGPGLLWSPPSSALPILGPGFLWSLPPDNIPIPSFLTKK